MRKYFYAALLTLFALASCHKSDDDSCVEEIIRRLDNLESAVATLEQKIEDGALIKSVTPIPGTPGGWRIEFTGGTPSSIDIVNGTNGTNGVTPKIEVHPNPDGSASLWVDDGSGWRNTNVDLTGPKGDDGESGGSGPQGLPGTNGVTPKIEVRENIDGTMTVWYNVTPGYSKSDWVNTNADLKAPSSANPLLSILDNKADGTVTFTLNDEKNPHDKFTFPKASTAIRFEIMTTAKTEVAEGEAGTVRFVVNPSNGWIPTGTGTQIAKWELNDVETRAGYVNASQNFSIESILPSGAGEGEYVATVRYDTPAFNIAEYVLALVLNRNSDADPVLVSSAPFVFGSLSPMAAAPDANSYIVAPGGSVIIDLGQVANEVSAGFRAAPRVNDGDDVTMELLWTDKQELLTEVAAEVLTPANSGVNTAFRVDTGQTEGNAVIAAKVNGTIVWSWHIWVTPYDPAVANKPFAAYDGANHPTSEAEPDANKELVFMDRNLGALNATPDDLGAMGMLYQWGRKDPFPANWQGFSMWGPVPAEPTIYTPAESEGTASGVVKISADIAGGMDYAAQNPLAFIYQGDSGYSWYSPTAAGPRSLWVEVSGTGASATVTKTVYDPCPAGWRVPAEGGHRVIHGTVTETDGWLGNNVAINGSYFPYVSFRMHIDGTMNTWYPVSACWFGQTYFDLFTFNLTTQTTSPAAYQALGVPVRCVRIE